MKQRFIIKSIAVCEIAIGLGTVIVSLTFLLLSISKKPFNVLVYVVVSGIISCSIGIGLLEYKKWARRMLLFFSGYVVLVKILMYINLLYFAGEVFIFISPKLKNIISFIYHTLIIVIFNKKGIKKLLCK